MDERRALQAWRWLHGLSRREFARRAGLSHVSIYKFESGAYRPDKEAAVAIELATDGIIRAEKLMDLDGLRKQMRRKR